MSCIVEFCGRNVFVRGLCRTHYRWQNEGREDLSVPIQIRRTAIVETSKCLVPNCERPPTNNGWCRACNARWRKRIGPVAPIKIKFVDVQGYIRWNQCHPENVFGRTVTEHYAVMCKYLGRELFNGENVHHVNGNRQDNRLTNLELWNTSQPPGQRVQDKIKWAKELLAFYGEDLS